MGLLMLMGDSGFRGALDTLGSGLESAWSVGRRLRSAYTGAIIRVRRSSDNSEQDFSGSDANGAVSASAVAAFCGAGDGFLTTIYDQSGAGRNLTQTTTANQIQVVGSGVAETKNGKLWGRCLATSSTRMSVPTSTATYKFLHSQPSTFYLVGSSDDNAVLKGFFATHTNFSNVGTSILVSATEQIGCTMGNGSAPVVNRSSTEAALASAGSVLTGVLDGSNATAANRWLAWLDGVSLTLGNTSSGTASTSDAESNFTMGARYSNSSYHTGYIGEMVLWSQNVSASRATWEANAKAFWGTP